MLGVHRIASAMCNLFSYGNNVAAQALLLMVFSDWIADLSQRRWNSRDVAGIFHLSAVKEIQNRKLTLGDPQAQQTPKTCRRVVVHFGLSTTHDLSTIEPFES